MGVKSSLDIAIPCGGAIRHVVAINSFTEEREWPQEYIPRLRLLGEIIVNTLERKRVLEELRVHEARLSLAAESADAGLWELDVASQYFWATPKGYELYGFDADSTVNYQAFLDVVHEDDRERVGNEVQDSIVSGKEFLSEYRIVLPGNRIRWMSVRARLAYGVIQKQRLTGISIDVSARKEFELALQAAHDEIRQLKDRLQQENLYLRQEVKKRSDHFAIIGQSKALRKVLHQAEQVAPTSAVVLIEGETGTGKELFAHAIHEASPRRERPMVCVNCGAIPGALIESELFGREKGAYTGALAKQVGRFELADGSTILLDEVGDLPLDLQVKLLRVLQERTIERLGSPKPVPVDVRVIAATNHDLEAAVREGRFRQDLYYRLSVFPIRVPPLRERLEDIPLLAWAFVEEFNKAMGKAVDSIARESMEAMTSYPWTGNVRELRNIIERGMILTVGTCLHVDLPALASAEASASSLQMNVVEASHIRSVLAMTGGRIRGKHGAAELLGLNPSTLESRMLKLGIQRIVH
jgi:PAS domain S-box-containing protein